MRYTLATGEPVFTGFMRTRPSSTAVGVGVRRPLLSAGRLARVGRHRGRRDLLPVRAASARDRRTPRRSTTSASATFSSCVAVLSIGRRIERTLELLNWVLVVSILGGFLVLAMLLRPGAHVAGGGRRARGLRRRARHVQLPSGGRGLLPARRARRVLRAPAASSTSRCRTGRATRATAWGSGRATSPAAIGGTR